MAADGALRQGRSFTFPRQALGTHPPARRRRLLGMQLEPTQTEGVVSFAVGLEQQLRPLIREALAQP